MHIVTLSTFCFQKHCSRFFLLHQTFSMNLAWSYQLADQFSSWHFLCHSITHSAKLNSSLRSELSTTSLAQRTSRSINPKEYRSDYSMNFRVLKELWMKMTKATPYTHGEIIWISHIIFNKQNVCWHHITFNEPLQLDQWVRNVAYLLQQSKFQVFASKIIRIAKMISILPFEMYKWSLSVPFSLNSYKSIIREVQIYF